MPHAPDRPEHTWAGLDAPPALSHEQPDHPEQSEQWLAPQPTAGTPPPATTRHHRQRALVTAAGVLAAAAVVTGSYWWGAHRSPGAEASGSSGAPVVAPGGGGTPSAAAPGSPTESATDPPASTAAATTLGATVTPTPAADAEAAALTALEAKRQASLQALVLDRRWVAQLSSKAVGTTDPLQVATNGSHVFYAADILDEVDTRTALVGGSTLLLASTDFGRGARAPGGAAYWVLLADRGFTDADAVRSWCASSLPDATQAERDDACAPRRLTPPA